MTCQPAAEFLLGDSELKVILKAGKPLIYAAGGPGEGVLEVMSRTGRGLIYAGATGSGVCW